MGKEIIVWFMDPFKLGSKIEIFVFNLSAIISNVDVIKTASEETNIGADENYGLVHI